MLAQRRLSHAKALCSPGEVQFIGNGDEVPEILFRGKGCRNCQGTGYRGRQGVFEMMPITDEIRALILERTSSRIIRKVAVEQGMSSLRQDGWRLIGEGRTTPDEVLRMTKDEDVAVGQADQKAFGGRVVVTLKGGPVIADEIAVADALFVCMFHGLGDTALLSGALDNTWDTS